MIHTSTPFRKTIFDKLNSPTFLDNRNGPMKEVKTRQVPDESPRQWLTSELFDITIWHRDHRMSGFQLEISGVVITLREGSTVDVATLDDGPCWHPVTPVLGAKANISPFRLRIIIDTVKKHSTNLKSFYRNRILETLEGIKGDS